MYRPSSQRVRPEACLQAAFFQEQTGFRFPKLIQKVERDQTEVELNLKIGTEEIKALIRWSARSFSARGFQRKPTLSLAQQVRKLHDKHWRMRDYLIFEFIYLR